MPGRYDPQGNWIDDPNAPFNPQDEVAHIFSGSGFNPGETDIANLAGKHPEDRAQFIRDLTAQRDVRAAPTASAGGSGGDAGIGGQPGVIKPGWAPNPGGQYVFQQPSAAGLGPAPRPVTSTQRPPSMLAPMQAPSALMPAPAMMPASAGVSMPGVSASSSPWGGHYDAAGNWVEDDDQLRPGGW